MKISKKGINLLKQFEGCRLTAYKCLPTEEKYTIGYGHYGVSKGVTITKDEAVQLLVKDVEKFEAKVNRYNGIYNFNQNQFDALVCFAYNIGSIEQLTINGRRSITEISNAIQKYVNSGGKRITGLVKRRKAEYKLFNTPMK
jgi:GH24 family phage-related lysozyme (muramidase)